MMIKAEFLYDRSMLARRVITWLWVRRFQGRQIDIARHLRVSSSVVARWYGEAVRRITDLEPLCDRVESLIPNQGGTAPSPGAKRTIRYGLTMDDEVCGEQTCNFVEPSPLSPGKCSGPHRQYAEEAL